MSNVVYYSPENAPGFAKHSSTFKNDDRCYENVFYVGDDENKVWRRTVEEFLANPANIDYDVNYSTEGDTYVGVVVRDYK